jgi:hypothetical protein
MPPLVLIFDFARRLFETWTLFLGIISRFNRFFAMPQMRRAGTISAVLNHEILIAGLQFEWVVLYHVR